MLLLYDDPRFLEHATGAHPESAHRLQTVSQHLTTAGLTDCCRRVGWEPASWERMRRVHHAQHLTGLEQMALAGGGRADPDTIVSPQSFDVSRLAAGAASDAVQRVLQGDVQRALALIRPPGHHALAAHAMGFCLLNNIAVAAQQALDVGLQRVLIVDWDVHHGNGTQAIFYEDPRVGFFSVHRWPFYPGTGSAAETGAGAGLGTTRNLPLDFNTSPAAYRSQVMRELDDFAARIRPELVLVSAGFDSHRADPIGGLGLEVEDFDWLTVAVVEIANLYAQGRIVSLLEGGYNPQVLAECVATHLKMLRAGGDAQ